jgi:ATP-dependent helicase HepA
VTTEAGVGQTAAESIRARFVQDSELGRGRIVGAEKAIRFFDSPILAEVIIPTSGRTYRELPLPEQQRAWWFDGEKWLVGRIHAPHAGGAKYWVNFPDGKTFTVPTDELRVRWSRPIADPLSLVKAGTVETRFFHTHRSAFLQMVARQRSASFNLRGLLSSAVEIYEHQVGAARRVLSDPIPRYLLADEVGLGKTIEAGMVIRQLMLDTPGGEVTVVVPDHLVGQWSQELDRKFGVWDLPGRVSIVAHSDVEQLEPRRRTLLVVDEAHRFTELVKYDDASIGAQKYNALKAVAHNTDALLLLSATPVRSNEDAFLGILHLLDPVTYRLDDLAGFRRRVEVRDDLAETMSALGEDTPARYLREPLDRLVELLPDDGKLADLVASVRQALENGDGDAAKSALASVRIHVSETYRLHRRMIRNRRPNVCKANFPVRGRDHRTDWLIADPDRRRDELLDLIESFRIELQELSLPNPEGILRVLLGRAMAPLRALSSLANALRGSDDHDLSNAELDALTGFAGTDSARELARQIDVLLSAESEQDRISAIVAWSRLKIGRGKFAIACSFPRVAAQLAEVLTQEFGRHRVLAALESQSNDERTLVLSEFARQRERSLLVVDRSVEEGANLQFADEVLHVNVPTVTTQLEQRLGRFDRWSEVLQPIHSNAFREADPVRDEHLNAWLRVLDGVFGIFNASTSTLQYVLADVEKEFFASAVSNGLASAAVETGAKSDWLEKQRRRISAQDLLDSIEDRSSDESLGASLAEIDGDEREITKTAEGYIHEMLEFPLTRREFGRLKFDKSESKCWECHPARYHRPLLPKSEIDALGAGLFAQEYTADRFHVPAGVGFLRYGSPLIDRFAQYAELDDRGRAFAVELSTPTLSPDRPPWLALCFDYTIAASVPDALSDPAFLRAVATRTEQFLPTTVERIWWMVGQGECPPNIVRDVEKRQGENLQKRPDRFRELTSNFDWPAVCDQTRQLALERIHSRPDLQTRFAQARSLAQQAAERDLAILAARSDAADRGDEENKVLDAVQNALANPTFELESCGAVFLTWVPRP